MDIFNITPEDKFNKYLELNPDFAVYSSTEPFTITKPNVKKPSKTNTLKTLGVPNIAKNTPVNSDVAPLISEDEKPYNSFERLREIYNGKLKPQITTNPFTFNKTKVNSLKQELANVESNGGNYKAFNPKGGGEGAVGKYQFRWNLWKDSIAKKTGITNKEEFMNNPQAQEDFFDFYQKSTLEPQLNKVKNEFPDTTYNDVEILKLLHFQGLQGVRDLFKKGGMDESTDINMSPLAYLKASKGK